MTDPTSSLHVSTPRLYVEDALAAGTVVSATEAQSHYLLHVMRRGAGEAVTLFNGRDGEWSATISIAKKRHASFTVADQRRPQSPEPDVWLMFAPLKTGPMEFLVEKATELGVAALMPVMTRRTVVHRVNLRRLEAIAMESAEQCERLTVPTIAEPRALTTVLGEWPTQGGSRQLFFCDEGAARGASAPPIITAMQAKAGPAVILTGPEGGFDPEEQALIRALPRVNPLVLGPRLLRAETAAIAALSCWQGLQGDWRGLA